MISDRMVSLRSWVGSLVVGATLIAFCTVGAALLLYRMPQLEAALQTDMQQRAASVGRLLDHYTESVEHQLMAVAALPGERPAREMQAYLESVVGDGRLFDVGFLLDHAGRVQGIGLPERHRQAATILKGIDFAFNPLFHEAVAAQIRSGEKPVAVWSDRYLSVLSGKNTVGVAVATPRHIVVGEVSLERILEMLVDSSAPGESVVTIADRRGLWLASSSPDAPGRHFNFSKLPLFIELLRVGDAVAQKMDYLGEQRIVGGVVSKRLRWVILASAPSGLDDAQTRVTVETIVAGALGALLLCVALSPMAALFVSSRISPLIALSQRVAEGNEPTDWPSGGRIRELAQLSEDLRRMVAVLRKREQALRENEQKLETIFQASPTAMLVASLGVEARVLAVNAAWERLFQLENKDVVGCDANELALWEDPADRARFVAQLKEERSVEAFEAWVVCGEGRRSLLRIDARTARVGEGLLLLVTLVDLTELRRIEHEVRALNAELEQRVAQRTEELSRTNVELASSLHELRTMQDHLVQTEKNAALGGMVAGLAHEINTPVGNALMAATSIQQGVIDFRGRLAQGVKRSEFESFLELLGASSEIAERNLHRAAELVSSFKQVAVDQTSDQRRRFDLSEVVREIVLTLQPTFRGTPYVLNNTIEPGCQLDSYPGALGQVLTNLINNAVMHGLDGRPAGAVRLAALCSGGEVEVLVTDDGWGIPAELQARIFEPFYTSKRGQGGTGLGLHISHGIVARVLGGSLNVRSDVGQGSAFILRIPRVAPQPETAGEVLGA